MHNAPFRLLRTVSVGATVLGLAAGAHLVAGGTLPAPGIMVALLALHVLCSTVATHFRLTLPAMVALLGSSQVVLHQAFETLSHSATAAPGTAGLHQHGLSAEANTAALLAAVNTTAAPGLEHLGHAGAMSGWMWAAHITATLATATLLAYGENALWSLANWLRPLYQRAAVVHVLRVQSARPRVIPRPLPRLPWRNLRPDTRRGPPAPATIFA
ncbi:hypothetical protein [Arthrobacter glacialis]|uniref:Uncharacterized protein n=1 Tax=Arthrobacter glacialis TaxID=1664 RepID=A0A2S4A1U6_ARTGL|nr:hypothetical protein [Arthrobacter glacialis]POH75354.1 hypothetical protein CVS27_01770 [Arthrobacter glacialis]